MNVLGIDIGGSGIKGAPIDTNTGELLAERVRIATPEPSAPAPVAKVIAQIAREYDWKGPVGCTFPAVMKYGVAHTAANVDKSWIGTDAAGLIGKETGCATTVINDADAAGVAEMQFGAGRSNAGVVIMLTFGTGIGTAIFVNHQLLPNCELGHMELCGMEAEHYASDGVRKRDDLSWEDWAERANTYIQRLDDLFWPDLFIIGGGVSNKPDKFIKYLKTRAQIEIAQCKNEAGMIGAALAARQAVEGH
jgi:polyphosphate glucokinase